MKEEFKIKNQTLKPDLSESSQLDTHFLTPNEYQDVQMGPVSMKGSILHEKGKKKGRK